MNIIFKCSIWNVHDAKLVAFFQQVNEQAEQIGDLQDRFKATSEEKVQILKQLETAKSNLCEKEGLVIEKDGQLTTVNMKVIFC